MLINDNNSLICELKNSNNILVDFPLKDTYFLEDFTPTYVLGDDNAPGTIFRARLDEKVVEFVPVNEIKPGDKVDESFEYDIMCSKADFQIKFEKTESLRCLIDFLEDVYKEITK